MRFSFWERMRTLFYTYVAIAVGLLASLLTGSVHIDSPCFWLTGLLAFTIVTVFDIFVLGMLDEEVILPSQFLLRMMFTVVLMQLAFAFIYYFTDDARSFLMHTQDQSPVTDFVDALYFSGVTLLTVGYGDIVPRGDFRFTAVAEVYGGTLFIFAFFTWGLGIVGEKARQKVNKKKHE